MKTRTRNLPPLHPETAAAVACRRYTNDDLSHVFQARGVSAELVELVETIRHCRGKETFRELYTEASALLAQVVGIAVDVDDAGFPAQLAFAMEYARNPATHRRRAIHQAWRHLTSGAKFASAETGKMRHFVNPTKDELHKMAELFHGAIISSRTLDDDLREMELTGFQRRSRGKPRKAG